MLAVLALLLVSLRVVGWAVDVTWVWIESCTEGHGEWTTLLKLGLEASEKLAWEG